jgi:hypothetical protein
MKSRVTVGRVTKFEQSEQPRVRPASGELTLSFEFYRPSKLRGEPQARSMSQSKEAILRSLGRFG